MRIKTKSGEVLDLAHARMDAQAFRDEWERDASEPLVMPEDASKEINAQASTILALLDTLESALSVPTPYLAAEECSSTPWSESDIFQRGLRRGAKTMRDAVRQAAGVVENETP